MLIITDILSENKIPNKEKQVIEKIIQKRQGLIWIYNLKINFDFQPNKLNKSKITNKKQKSKLSKLENNAAKSAGK